MCIRDSIMGTIVAGFSFVAVVAVVGLAIAGYVLLIAPAFGIAVGTIGSRLDRAAMRSNSRTVVATGRTAATAVWFVLLFGGPAVIGFVLTVGCRWLGLP
jgi:hypothetical protein